MNAIAAPGSLQAAGDAFLSRFDDMRDVLTGEARLRAAEILRARGLPGPREEEWRFTRLRSLADVGFGAAEPGREVVIPASVAALDAALVVFVDGFYRPELSRAPGKAGLRTGAPAMGSLARPDSERLVALNTMLTQDGMALSVAEGVDAGTVVLLSLGGEGVAFHPRHDVHLARGAKLTLIDIAMGDGCYLNNPVTSMSVAEGAVLTHLRWQDEGEAALHFSTVYADVAAGGTYDSFALTLGGKLARMEVHARLGGAGAAAHLNAAQLLGGSQHADFTTVVRHDAPGTQSRQTVKNVLTANSRAVFQGKIEVARIAQKTDGYQMNQTLLLSDEAEINAKPQLEIYADDVKCSHGATVGALDADQYFYLRSRGVPAGEARALLVRAFLNEALDPIAHDAGRAMLEGAVAAWWERHTP
jgi:Fe-S cluster assembly protein SufD